MKLTKGKINKLYKKKRQSLKKIKNKNKNKSKRHTFRKHKKINLARKSLKKFRGGADEPIGVNIIEKKFNTRPGSGSLIQTPYMVGPDGNLMNIPVTSKNGQALITNGPMARANGPPIITNGPALITNGPPITTPSLAANINQTNVSKNPRETAVEVVDQIYIEMHQNDQQDSSKSVNEFAHKMAEKTQSDSPQITNEPIPPQITNGPTNS